VYLGRHTCVVLITLFTDSNTYDLKPSFPQQWWSNAICKEILQNKFLSFNCPWIVTHHQFLSEKFSILPLWTFFNVNTVTIWWKKLSRKYVKQLFYAFIKHNLGYILAFCPTDFFLQIIHWISHWITHIVTSILICSHYNISRRN
jgi:hypothetical protein